MGIEVVVEETASSTLDLRLAKFDFEFHEILNVFEDLIGIGSSVEL